MKDDLIVGEVVKKYETKVWIETDFLGSKHVMVQHMDQISDPFTYCTFHYHHCYTSNAAQMAAATTIARHLGAHDPIEVKMRPMPRLIELSPTLQEDIDRAMSALAGN